MVEGITENTKIHIHVGGNQYPLTVNQYNTFFERLYSGEYNKMDVSEFKEMIEGI